MSGSLRVVDSGLLPSRRNVAVTAAMIALHRAGRIPDTLRIYQYPAAVLLGRGQVLHHAVDAARCVREGVEIARRISGGGAVYVDPDILTWDLIAGRARLGARLPDAAARAGAWVVDALARLGVASRFRPPGDVVIADAKVAGSAGSDEGSTLMLQGTLILRLDRAAMAAVLWPQAAPQPKLCGLADALGATPSVAAVSDALAQAAPAHWGATHSGALGEAETRYADTLFAERFGSDAFVADGDPDDTWPQARAS